ncbi:MAG TPA: nuclear transport factor 2 family protein [Steroidobacteraceae bacterium]|nr:nuclear transport factor 2 family protein [Steroidobacteraceae bacterium]
MSDITTLRAVARRALLLLALLAATATPAMAAPPSEADFAALKARVQEVQDRLEIQQLVVEYGHLLDTHDLVGYSNLFAQDGEWIGGFGRAKGPKAILAMMNKYIGTTPFDPRNVKGFHLLTNIVIHLDGDHAKVWSRIIYMVRNKDDKPSPAMGGHYDDIVVRENGHWKFQRRVVMMEIPFQDPREIKGEPPPAPAPGP